MTVGESLGKKAPATATTRAVDARLLERVVSITKTVGEWVDDGVRTTLDVFLEAEASGADRRADDVIVDCAATLLPVALGRFRDAACELAGLRDAVALEIARPAPAPRPGFKRTRRAVADEVAVILADAREEICRAMAIAQADEGVLMHLAAALDKLIGAESAASDLTARGAT